MKIQPDIQHEQKIADITIHDAGTVVTEEEEEESTLPMKDLFRVDEVASYFSVSERTIRLWVDNGHLDAEKIVGSVRISRRSILRCRFNKKEVVL